jgi:predicted transcriptional regulator
MKIKSDLEDNLVRFFGSTSRARILLFLYAHAGRTFYQREIMFETGLSLQTTQRELGNLADLGIIKKQETNHKVYYQVNSASPFFRPLKEICSLSSEE